MSAVPSVALTPKPRPDKAAILAALAVMFEPDDVIELRAFARGKKRTNAGYFDSEHREALADAAVTGLDAHRAPAAPEELARRRAAKLTARQEAHLLDWGYPYVLEEWRFHVTLTRRLEDAARAEWQAAAEAALGAVAGVPRLVREVCVFTQAAPGAPFLVAERLKVGRQRQSQAA